MAGIYVHIPYCKSKCGYCAFDSCADTSETALYRKRLIAEIDSRVIADTVETIYFGGGTPTFCAALVADILEHIGKRFKIAAGAEISSEANPDSLTKETARLFHSAGINRLSVGLQSACDSTLRAIGRPHTAEDFVRAIERARAAGFESLSADIILSLPNEGVREAVESVKLAATFAEHVSAYGFTPEEGTRFSEYRADPDLFADCYEAAYAELRTAGFARYEVSNFAKTGFECRHNIGYWRRKDYLGFGASAHSLEGDIRRANPAYAEYLAGTPPELITLTAQDKEEELIMLALRLSEGLDLEVYRTATGRDFSEKYGKKFDKLHKLGMLMIEDGRFLRLTDRAFLIMNSVLAELLV